LLYGQFVSVFSPQTAFISALRLKHHRAANGGKLSEEAEDAGIAEQSKYSMAGGHLHIIIIIIIAVNLLMMLLLVR